MAVATQSDLEPCRLSYRRPFAEAVANGSELWKTLLQGSALTRCKRVGKAAEAYHGDEYLKMYYGKPPHAEKLLSHMLLSFFIDCL
jgi:hypothetical protein